MAALTFPALGTRGHGERPGVPQIYQVTAGFTGSGADVIMTTQAAYAIANVVAGDYILRTWVKVTTAFTATATLNIGITGGDTDGIATTVLIDPQTDDDTAGLMALQSTTAYAVGAYFAAADTIDVLVGVADLDAGLMTVYFEHMHAGNIIPVQ